MLSAKGIGGLVLAAACVWAAGCGSVRPKTVREEGEAPLKTPTKEAKVERELERLAKAHAHFAAAVVHDLNDRPEAALAEFFLAASQDPDNETLVMDVSRRLLQNKEPEKALELLKVAGARSAASGAVLARLGMVYSQLGKYAEGAVADREAIKRSPRGLAGYQNLFVGELHNRRPQSALQVLDEAGRQNGVDAEFLIGLSELYVTFGLQVPAQKEATRAKALSLLQRAQQLHPPSPQLRIKLADGLNAMGDPAGAAQLYLGLLDALPESPVIRERIRAKLAELYLQNSDHAHAAEQLQAMLREDPTNPQVYYYLGSIAYEDKKLPEAAENFSKTLVLNPDFEQAYYDLASVQINLNRTSDALATLGKAREKFGQNSPKFVLEFLTGVALSQQKAYAEAVAHYTAAEVIASASEPKRLDGLFYFQVGAACERKGDLAQAEKYFDKCLALKPDFAEALNYSGYMWAEQGIKLEQARQRIEKAVKLEPKNGAYLDSLGWVLFKLNQPQGALEYLLKATDLLDEPDATVYDHLGDVYAALNKPEQAREAWRKSLAVEPSGAVRRKLEAAGTK